MAARSSIGPDSWARATTNSIRLTQLVNHKSDRYNLLARKVDPVPSLRDDRIQQSNNHIQSYVRETRKIVVKLGDCLLDTNEAIKSLLRGKEKLEKTLEHIRKDIILNEESQQQRKIKPIREKEVDGADELLAGERKQLVEIKRALEIQLKIVLDHLHVLDESRKRLTSVHSERIRVLDLICHTTRNPPDEKSLKDVPSKPAINPLGPFTPEAVKAMDIANQAIRLSTKILKDVKAMISRTTHLKNQIQWRVNYGISKKAEETSAIKQHLKLVSGENRKALHRSDKWRHTTDLAHGYTLGPQSSLFLTTRERLDRPSVKTYQRHPGTQLPEARCIIEGNDGLERSLQTINRNIGMLSIIDERIKADIKDKHIGAAVDANIVRNRRRKANHRWVIGGINC